MDTRYALPFDSNSDLYEIALLAAAYPEFADVIAREFLGSGGEPEAAGRAATAPSAVETHAAQP